MKYTLRLCGVHVAVTSGVSTDTSPFQAIMEVLGTVKLFSCLFLWDGVHRALKCYLQAVFGDFSLAYFTHQQQLLMWRESLKQWILCIFTCWYSDRPRIRGAVESKKNSDISLTSFEKCSIRTGLRNKQQTPTSKLSFSSLLIVRSSTYSGSCRELLST